MDIKIISTTNYDSNVYLINEKVLIDAGMSHERIINSIEKYVDIEKIELIILTHAHYDHIGSVPELLKRCNAKVGIFKDESIYLNDNELNAASAFGVTCPEIKPDILYSDGDEIFAGTDSKGNENYLTVIHTPGHTKGSMCLYEKNEKILFSGDTVFSDGGIGRSDFKNSISEKMTESLQKLVLLDVEKIYPGHAAPTLNNAEESLKMSYRMSSLMNG